MIIVEAIPIPERRARDRRPIHVETRLRSFPGQEFAFRFDWNNQIGDSGRWVVEIEHLDRNLRVTKAPATPIRPYSYLPWVVFVFFDPSNEQMQVTPRNLGDEMQLWAIPGPDGADPDQLGNEPGVR